jgi:hypothetical protein
VERARTGVKQSATAEAEAVVRDHGQVTDTQEWTRTVTIQGG